MNHGLAEAVERCARDWHSSPYYDLAEQWDWLNAFWGSRPDRPFKRLFDALNLKATVELAVGHGRHASKVVDLAPSLTLMDVVKENIDHCKQRFQGRTNVVCIQNDGHSFRPLPDASVTAIFCYDAMVHFEFDVVLSYIRDTARVLVSGGRALYHHSNLVAYPGADYLDNPGWRNFMSQALFLHAAQRAGLEVIESVIMDWDAPQTDCLSLLEKNISSAAGHR